MAEIINFDTYLEEYRKNILVSIVEALGMDPNREADIQYMEKVLAEVADNLTSTEQQKLEETLIASLEESNIDMVREMLGLKEITWENDSMDYVDVAHGYNFRCIMDSETTQNSFMDWLEEGGYDYLIDNEGRFAIKSPNREQQYRIGRQVDKFAGRWDRPIAGTNVDPTVQKAALREPPRPSLDEDEKDSTSFKDVSHSPSPFTDETRDDDEDDELNGLAEKFQSLDEARKSKTKTARQKEKEAKDKIDALGPKGKGGAAAIAHASTKKVSGPHSSKKGKKGHDKKEMRKKIDISETMLLEGFTLSEEIYPLIDSWMKEMQQRFENPAEIYEYMVNFFVKGAETTQELAEEWSVDILRHYKLLNEELIEAGSVLSAMTAMPTLTRIKTLAGISLSPDSSITTITTKPTGDPGTPKIIKLPGVAEARELIAKAFGFYKNMPADQQEVFKKFMIDNLMGSTVRESINESDLLELTRKGKPLDNEERVIVANILTKHWRSLALDIEAWRNRGNDLEKVELAILLLRKVANKIGMGLI